jgi:hypothetical protein
VELAKAPTQSMATSANFHMLPFPLGCTISERKGKYASFSEKALAKAGVAGGNLRSSYRDIIEMGAPTEADAPSLVH